MEVVSFVVAEAPAPAKDIELKKLCVKNGDHKNVIHVSNNKKPLVFYLNLAKKYMKLHNDVELSALGMAIPTVVTIAEILKSKGFAIEKKILISTIGSRDDAKGRIVQKAKIAILLGKNEDFQNPTVTAAPESKQTSRDTDE